MYRVVVFFTERDKIVILIPTAMRTEYDMMRPQPSILLAPWYLTDRVILAILNVIRLGFVRLVLRYLHTHLELIKYIKCPNSTVDTGTVGMASIHKCVV